ncbi:MAG: MBOAT family protein [Prolixibacteraceae bacterium]|jgi:alginate O-acetyltransferase complex protein AlgI|nr:MBOAT family protein [Prolixibacteraceae bacterium]MBT6763553.1 MBOAT family protein [Prolixibacteraceae bacterium]MBT6996909.1 MBOAT family protein [Prolixibacteraceae bacterium]MBT7396963.1 MBOAT family protein [Prolixibacteraceae bacterium]
MIFSTPVFIFLFLPITLLLVWGINKKFHNLILLIASIFFYSWGSIPHAFILILSILGNYLFGLFISNSRLRFINIRLGLGIIFNLIVLGFFKYFNFFIENLNWVLLSFNQNEIGFEKIALPIGISFFTFQAISYLIDISRKTAPVQKNIINLALYISLFPQLIAGPIVRYKQISKQLENRNLSIKGTVSGIQRFIFGLAKKLIVANSMAVVADQIFSSPIADISPGVAWLGILAYTIQIYFDFSGYSDMAIGLGKIFGFNIPENFNFPYISKSIKEFWRRWHISLSMWFKDYLYIPLGGNRGTTLRTIVNLLIVFFFTGFWHGANWNFIIWGMFHGVFLLLERIGLGNLLEKIWRPIRILYTLLVVIIAWVFFRIESINEAFQYLSRMFLIDNNLSSKIFVIEFIDKKNVILWIFAIFYSLRFFRGIKEFLEQHIVFSKKNNAVKYILITTKYVFTAGLFFLTVLYLSGATYNPFIYFRF